MKKYILPFLLLIFMTTVTSVYAEDSDEKKLKPKNIVPPTVERILDSKYSDENDDDSNEDSRDYDQNKNNVLPVKATPSVPVSIPNTQSKLNENPVKSSDVKTQPVKSDTQIPNTNNSKESEKVNDSNEENKDVLGVTQSNKKTETKNKIILPQQTEKKSNKSVEERNKVQAIAMEAENSSPAIIQKISKKVSQMPFAESIYKTVQPPIHAIIPKSTAEYYKGNSLSKTVTNVFLLTSFTFFLLGMVILQYPQLQRVYQRRRFILQELFQPWRYLSVKLVSLKNMVF